MTVWKKLTIEKMDSMAAMKPPPQVFHVYPEFHAAIVKDRQKKPAATDTEEYLNFTTHQGIPVIVLEVDEDDHEEE